MGTVAIDAQIYQYREVRGKYWIGMHLLSF